MPSSVITTEELVFITEEADQSVLSETLETTIFFTVGHQGPPGPTGQIGPAGGSTLQRMAGATLSALMVVYELDGEVFALDKDDDTHIDLLLGLTVTAANIGSPINVQRSGPVDNSGWAWTPGRVYLGSVGALTQTPATNGNDALIGRAVSATRLLLDIQDPIDLE